jgi:hypothetical protein
MKVLERLPETKPEPWTIETTETEWGVAHTRGWSQGVSVCKSDEDARQHEAAFGGELVSRTTYTVRWS